jgi:hypothetical protein
MKPILALPLSLLALACQVKDGGQGHRQNQEQETAPKDYTEGTDTRTPARRN